MSNAPEQRPQGVNLSTVPLNRLLRLVERIALTRRYLGWKVLVWRALTFPLRYTPLRHRLRLAGPPNSPRAKGARWYRDHGRPVTVVIPTYGDPAIVSAAVRSVRETTHRSLVRIVVADDASSADHVSALQQVEGIDHLILGDENVGFAANANRGLRAADSEHDIVLLNADVVTMHPSWLACLQHATTGDDVGVVGALLLYPDGRIQHAGVHRNCGAPQWFDHRYRFKPANHGPANVTGEMLAVTGACMYVTRETIDAIGLLDERYPMAYEDVDWCLRAWDAGFRVLYHPAAVLEHHESTTRGTEVGERERASQAAFWERWSERFDLRKVHTEDGNLRIVYVTEGTGVGGGHRDIFEHLDRLIERGHDAALYTLGERPDWYDLRAPVYSFDDYEDLSAALADIEAIKVATWWNTAAPVWRASVRKGIPVFFVQDIETSYYPEQEWQRFAVLSCYRSEFRYMTISGWNQERLRELGLESVLIPPGIDLGSFRPLEAIQRRDDMLLALGRTNPLKNLPLTVDAWQALSEPRPELCLFGIEPELGPEYGARYVERPSDTGVNELLNEASVFVQTSTHEGFCLPPLEAMATGCAVVCTDAHGNRDFCVDGENCLMPEPTVKAVSTAIARLQADPVLRARLGAAGTRTATEYAWDRRIDALESFLTDLATPVASDHTAV